MAIIIDKPLVVSYTDKVFEDTVFVDEKFVFNIKPLKTSANLGALDKSEKSNQRTFEFTSSLFIERVADWSNVFVEKDVAKDLKLDTVGDGDEDFIEISCTKANKKFIFEYAYDLVTLIGTASDRISKERKDTANDIKKK